MLMKETSILTLPSIAFASLCIFEVIEHTQQGVQVMTETEKEHILKRARKWFKEVVIVNHIKNTMKLADISKFKVNPFTTLYLSNFLTGDSNPRSIAKALIYPRVLGTSISTSFGQNMQTFVSGVLQDSCGSLIPGIDIEFIDATDKRKKYCQVKAGPDTINKDDVETIAGHFKATLNKSRTDKVDISYTDLVMGVVYGTSKELNGHYKRLTEQYHVPVFAGENFWHRLTGDSQFYFDLIKIIGEVAIESDFKDDLEDVINSLSECDEIQSLSEIV